MIPIMPPPSWFIAGSVLFLSLPIAFGAKGPHQCTEKDYYYEYTECDSTGSRWRVAIPQRGQGSCTSLPEPVRGTECTFSCEAGEFLELSAQECTQCAAGTYSLGSGVRFDDWESLPAGFSSLATDLDNGPGGDDNLSCNSSSWIPQGSYLESNRDECTVSLIYAVHLKKQGSVSFEYQYPDDNLFFQFFIQNDQCQELDQTADKKWLQLTTQGNWATHSVNLKSGTNILYWRTAGIVIGTKVLKPVLLKNVHIEGVAYTSECFPCKPGTFSPTPGSSRCQPCPRDTHSGHGASSCTLCNTSTHYAPEGSSGCKARPPCSTKDYFQIHTPCDKEGKTQVMYRWVQPQICLVSVAGAETLPPSGAREPCPPCNPGFYNNDTATCSPCPPGTFSDGVKACESCPAGTEPVVGYQYKWWNVLPANMKTSCFNVGNSKCDGMNGWEVAGDHIQSGAGGSDNDYLILNLHVPGFKTPTSVTGGAGTEFGRIVFEFEMVCSADCELYFMVDVNRKSTKVLESWNGSKDRQSYTHIMNKNASVSYTWAFQRTNQPSDVSTHSHTLYTLGHHPNVYTISLGSVGTLMNGPSFTSKGTKYYHLFNISLCGGEGRRAVCTDNVTDLSSADSPRESGEITNVVDTFICQSTIIPSSGRGFRTALSSQSISLADTFLGATVALNLDGVQARPDLFPQTSNKIPDVNFYYRYVALTVCVCVCVCKIKSCPHCSPQDYHQIEGACKGRQQDKLFVWNEPKRCVGGVSLPEKLTLPCESLDFLIMMGAVIGVFAAAVLLSITCYFWKKNKRLEYKYSKLVMSSNKECELPGADSCAMMEGEENEGDMEDEVVYSKKISLIRKLKAIALRGNRDNYENVQLNSSQSNGLVWG
uniref:Uncharacterized protein n=1 Tax=Esox lucius TaxID=8010 RepID=A0A6Q2YKR8_ESOLU